jgi:hypothetical protein
MTANLTLLDLLDALPAPSHRGDPSTSREAAAKVKVGAVARKVIAALARAGEHGTTDDELGIATGVDPPHSAATRRGELAKLGLVEPTGERRDTSRGNPAVVHRLTEEGRRLAAELAKEW